MSDNPFELPIAAELMEQFASTDDLDLYLQLAEEVGGPVLDLACGTGRCLLPLIRAGYDVVAVDSSQQVLTRLKKRLRGEPDDIRHRATAIAGEIQEIVLPLKFGLALIADGAFSYLQTKNEQDMFVATVYDRLRPGGLFVVDVFNPDLGRLLEPSPTVRTHNGYRMTHTVTRVDLSHQVLHLETTYHHDERQIAETTRSLRYVFRFELEHMLEKAGFEILYLWGDYLRSAFQGASARIVIVARKPADTDLQVIRVMEAALPQHV